jgi:hypothetical protein
LVQKNFSDARASIGTQYYASIDERTNFELMADARPGWVRYPVWWGVIEREDTDPDNYNWYSTLEDSVANASQAGVQILLTISDQPEWAADYPMGPPHDEEALLEFVYALVERYDGDGIDDAPGSPIVEHFELYNEQDNTDAFRASGGTHGYWGNQGTEYGHLLQKLYPVVKAANPNAQLVTGGIALDWFVKDGGVFDSKFLDDMLAACRNTACFDVMNFHYYPVFHGVWSSYGYGVIGKTNYVRQTMAKYGMADRPIFCTEIGWSGGEAMGWGGEEAQARYAVQGFVRGLSADLSMIIWFKAHDKWMEVEQPGLLDVSLAPKPSYYAFKTTARELAGVDKVRALTESELGSTQIEGYRFHNYLGRRVDVVWTTDDSRFDPDDNPVVDLTVNATMLNVTDKLGNEQMINDLVDGRADGKITLQLDGSPLFLEYLE